MAEDDKKPDEARRDVLFVGPRSDDGDGYKVVRRRDDAIELGELRAAKEGKPIHGDVVRLSPRPEHERLFDVEVVHGRPASAHAKTHAGPAQVATDAYRTNWEAIFTPGEPASHKGPGELN
ncbi:MAG TPA: hypothetical protein VGM56_28385 [Byssovorax sp.]|jgi:hypothetical protein